MRLPSIRFTVRHAMVTVVALSVGLACLKLASETTAGVALALTLALLASIPTEPNPTNKIARKHMQHVDPMMLVSGFTPRSAEAA